MYMSKSTRYGGLIRYYPPTESIPSHESYLETQATSLPEARGKLIDGAMKTSHAQGVSIAWAGEANVAKAIRSLPQRVPKPRFVVTPELQLEVDKIPEAVQVRIKDAMNRGVLSITNKILKRKHKTKFNKPHKALTGSWLATTPSTTPPPSQAKDYSKYSKIFSAESMEKAAAATTFSKGSGL